MIRDIKSVYGINGADEVTAGSKIENNIDPFKISHPHGWEHGFVIETPERKYTLYSKDFKLKELFLYMLNQILKKKHKF